MNHQYGLNGARNISSDYNQIRAYVESSPNQSKKSYTLSTFPSSYQQNFEDSGKVLEFCQSIPVQLTSPRASRTSGAFNILFAQEMLTMETSYINHVLLLKLK